ncbi:MAG: class I SAM-dependent methyltransferase [Oscillospiraceae bacterium]
MNSFKISYRLRLIADFIKDDSNVLDIGCDHGFLSLYLIKNKSNIKVTASDINEKPLLSAKKNIEKHGLIDKINLVLSDGVKNIDLTNISDIIIAGMGGELIFNIISEIKKTDVQKFNFILQPMSNVYYLRKKLVEYGFFIEDEIGLKENGKNYTIMNVYYTDKKNKNIDQCFFYFGLLKDKKDKHSLDYKNHIIDKLKIKLVGLKKAKQYNNYTILNNTINDLRRYV